MLSLYTVFLENFMNKILILFTFTISLFLNVYANSIKEFQSNATAQIKERVKKNNITIVDSKYLKKALDEKSAIIIDARPIKFYNYEHIPTALLLSSNNFLNNYKKVLKDVKKDKEIIVYCNGYNCPASSEVASLLIQKGYKNIKLFAAGMVGWKKDSHKTIKNPTSNNLKVTGTIQEVKTFTKTEDNKKSVEGKWFILNYQSHPKL